MDIILIPGLWLDATSWDDVIAPLERAGHRVRALTMPGVGEPASTASTVGISDWVAAGVAAVDSVGAPVVVVGHSGGGNVAWGVADSRPHDVSRVVFVDSVPPPPGVGISEFAEVDGVIPFPGWDFFPEQDVADLDEATRARTAPRAQSVPPRVTTDPISLTDPARFRVPVTLLMGSLDREGFEAEVAEWGAFADEFHSIDDAEVVRIDSGHWPQFSIPERLARFIDEAVRAS